jgi:threonine/homoserine/homoserine lactone efflux protein
LYLPVIFATATGIPVILFAWLIAFSLGSLGGFYNKLKAFEYWFRRVIAVLFIAVGVYYLNIFFS